MVKRRTDSNEASPLPAARELQADELTWREHEILTLLARHLSNKQIGEDLFLAVSTVKWYNQQIFSKLGVSNRAAAVKKAAELSLLVDPAGNAIREEPQLRTNLRAELTSFVGRDKEILQLRQLLSKSRLLVLTGVGGSGKTRLAIKLAKDLQPDYRDGVWLVELSGFSDPAMVPSAIATALNITTHGDTKHLDLLKGYLQQKQLLLVLDNFEHLLSAAPIVGELLAAAPKIRVLATSRERLNIYGEQEYSLDPLELPAQDHSIDLEKLVACEAVELFLQRAGLEHSGLDLTLDEAEAISRICRLLDGLPLAIELSAPLVKIYGLRHLAHLLEKDLEAIPLGPRDLPERQQTLQATMDWSFQLLEDQQKTLFSQLSVFSHGGTLESIRAICGSELSGNIVTKLVSLVEKNLLIPVEADDGEMHFTMLETIRQYGRNCLTAESSLEPLRRRHAQFYTELAERANQEILGERNVYWFKRLRVENQEFHAALAWAFGSEHYVLGLRMVAALHYHWYYNGLGVENKRWLDLALEKSVDVEVPLRLAVLLTAGQVAYGLGDLERSTELHLESLKLCRSLGDEFNLGISLLYLALFSAGSADGLNDAKDKANSALDIFKKLGDTSYLAVALNMMGEISRLEGDYEAAKRHYLESLTLSQETGERLRQAIQYLNLAFIAYHEADYLSADRLNKESLLIFVEMGSFYGMASILASVAGPVAALGFPHKAARLLGAANAQLETLGTDQQPADQPEIKMFISQTREILGEEAFEKAWQEGQRMTIQEAVDYARQDELVYT